MYQAIEEADFFAIDGEFSGTPALQGRRRHLAVLASHLSTSSFCLREAPYLLGT